MDRLISKMRAQQDGFTLVEIIVVCVLLGIIAAIGTTYLLNVLPNMRANSAIRDVYSIIMRAKTEAIRRGENVTVLFDTANNNYVLFLDRQPQPALPPALPPATDNNNLVDPNETVLAAATAFPTGVTYDPTVVGGDGVGDGVTFASNTCIFSMRGLPQGIGRVGIQAVDRAGNIRQRVVVVSIAGRVNIQ